MLRPEEAREQLKTFAVAGWQERLLHAVGAERGHVRAAGYGLLHRGEDGQIISDRLKAQEHEWNAYRQLDALCATERLQLFALIFPGMPALVEAAWQLHMRLPYQIGWQRKAFHAPHQPALTLHARMQWLQSLMRVAGGYDQAVAWFAAWAPYLSYGAPHTLGLLFAAAIDAGGASGQQVFDILCASARGEHPIGAMGHHVTRGLLVSSRPDGWTFVEQLLLAAQRQEGLRQVILETVDLAHPEALRRLLRLILDHDLTRFSATLRALDVWLGFGETVDNARALKSLVATLLDLLDSAPARARAQAGGDAEAAYLALWAGAYHDAPATVAPAEALLGEPSIERRFAAALLLKQLALPEAQRALLPALDDPDLRVVAVALAAYNQADQSVLRDTDLFERLERLVPRLPRHKTELKPLVWPWLTLRIELADAARLLTPSLGARPPERLLPHLASLDGWQRVALLKTLAEKAWNGAARELAFKLAGDPSHAVREGALQLIAQQPLDPADAQSLERLLTRQSGDVRRGVLSLLARQADEPALASAERLLHASDAQQRVAGLELLRLLSEAERRAGTCRARAEAYRAERKTLGAAEQHLLDALLATAPETLTLDDALGLLDPYERTDPPDPVRPARFARAQTLVTPAALSCLRSLDSLVHALRETPLTLDTPAGPHEQLLGNVRWGFPAPNPELPPEEDLARLPLREQWEKWWRERPSAERDADGFELLRALAVQVQNQHAYWQQMPQYRERLKRYAEQVRILYGEFDLRTLQYPGLATSILGWLLRAYSPAGAADYLLDVLEFTLTLIPQSELTRVPEPNDHLDAGWRERAELWGWLRLAHLHRHLCGSAWLPAHHARLWCLLCWMDEPAPNVPRHRAPIDVLLAAYAAGAATEADLLDQLLGPRAGQRGVIAGFGGLTFVPRFYGAAGFNDLRTFSGRKGHPWFSRYPILAELVARCRERIVTVEAQRGDMPTEASLPALDLRWSGGLEALVPLLQALGKADFVRGWSYDSQSKASVLSHLVDATFPVEGDTPERFAGQVKNARIAEQRLIDLALYAPQWARHVEHALEWPALESAVWWLHAHTKDRRWHVDEDIRAAWNAETAERTPLSGQQLMDGAVDVAWFQRTYTALGSKRWARLDKAAKYTSGGTGHARARLFASAMLGQATLAELRARMLQKRNQDAARALGLLPLAGTDEILSRYQLLQEFLRTSRKYGSMRRANEKLAVEMGMANLARTAGYPDPLRLEWAMEARANADLAQGPVVAGVDDVVVALALDGAGQPALSVTRAGKKLKAVPAAFKKDERIVALQARKQDIERQRSRMRSSLEQAMCRGDTFGGEELRDLMRHPVLAPMLRELVFVGDGAAGYPDDGGCALRTHAGLRAPLPAACALRIAHPHDLLQSGQWHAWQRECFAAQRTQPFKQVFRELYLLSAVERGDAHLSRRYAGHQVNPRQALALLGQRGWVAHPEEGVRRTFHEAGLSAWVNFLNGWGTPAEVEGLTLEGVQFAARGSWQPLDLAQVPPRIFSEVMRDLDLVVSVAHAGGVDPEASVSTVEMRAALVQETSALLKLSNVRVQGNFALVDGRLNHYSVHLGSAVVHQLPGGALCIVPVHSQQRGRLFLPFADNDPKSAELLSKVIMLAHDEAIQDPVILQQILAPA